ncbi:hypothetical protein K469DRAFT_697482 [Zopfia rhizophila CBS 207.26]|uniref:Uncharacterized protein n=1 Tax=Zopfia rhizophila CBS 207.26 TaxID=1314779 RepID=A0A6A6DC76_9PEZI|nr:hypothetical protein K469DRAFT_697482 [Zopfia rhizophila CBS 207.26]
MGSSVESNNCRKGRGGCSHKIVLPVKSDSKALDVLFQACEPTTFGHTSKDVYDEDDRRASKVDDSQFSTNFSLCLANIVSVIEKALLPIVAVVSPKMITSPKKASSKSCRRRGSQKNVEPTKKRENIDPNEEPEAKLTASASNGQSSIAEHREKVAPGRKLHRRMVRAEPPQAQRLLQDFSKVHAYADNPRSPSQFGSLVVCLSCEYERGQLAVRYGDKSATEAAKLLSGAFKGVDMVIYAGFHALGLEVLLRPVILDGHDDQNDWDSYRRIREGNRSIISNAMHSM